MTSVHLPHKICSNISRAKCVVMTASTSINYQTIFSCETSLSTYTLSFWRCNNCLISTIECFLGIVIYIMSWRLTVKTMHVIFHFGGLKSETRWPLLLCSAIYNTRLFVFEMRIPLSKTLFFILGSIFP